MIVNIEKYREMLVEAAIKKNCRKEVAEQVVDCMVQTDMLGVLTHGTTNLRKYLAKMNNGGLNSQEDPTVITEGPTWARLDGKNGFGMYNGRYAMDVAMEKAKESGMAMVTVDHSGHFGACSNFTLYAAEKGFLAIAMSNAVKLMCVPGGKGNVIGNSPISYAIPNEKGHEPFMDIALSEVAKLKVVQYQKAGKEVPAGWCVDENGVPTTHPEGNKFSLLPAAAHKGYCMAFFVEVLTTVLSGGSFDVKSWLFTEPQVPSEISHTFIVFDVSKMMDLSEFTDRLLQYTEEITGAPKAQGSDKIFYPGEPNWIQYDKAVENGLDLPDSTLDEVKLLFEETGLRFEDCLK